MREKIDQNIVNWATYFLLIVSITSLCLTKFIPSLDGPQHLHTVNVLAEILKGNDFMESYYRINPTIVGYWSSHFIIVLFRLIFPSWLAEKAYMIVFVIVIFIAFRFIISQLTSNKWSVATLLIFPFTYSTYQLLGYHTFSFAAIFYFIGLGLLIKYIKEYKIKSLILLLFATLGVFLSHALVFVFYLISVAIIYLGVLVRKDLAFKSWILEGLKIFLTIIPSILLWAVYINSVMNLDDTIHNTSLSFFEQLKEFVRIRLLVGFSHGFESNAYYVLFLVISVLVLLSSVTMIKSIKKESFKGVIKKIFSSENIFLIISIFFLGLYFFAPVRFSAGNLTNRYGLYFFYNLIIWLSTKKFDFRIKIGSAILIIAIFVFTRNFHVRCYKDYDKKIKEIKEVEQYVEPNSLIYHTIIQQDWMDNHFPLYIGTDIPVVNFRNPQCWGHFPVVWNFAKIPNVVIGEKDMSPRYNKIESRNSDVKKLTYYMIYNTTAFKESNEYDNLKSLLTNNYDEIFISSNGLITLYKLKE